MSPVRKNLITTWARAVDLTFDGFIGIFLSVLYLTLFATSVPLVLVAGVGVLIAIGTAALTRLTGAAERQRAMALHQVAIAPPARKVTTHTGPLRPFAQALTDLVDPVTWRVVLHHILSMVLGSILLGLYALAVSAIEWLMVEISRQTVSLAWPIAAAVVAVTVLIAYIIGAGSLDRALSGALLGTPRSAELADRVDALADARQGAVDAADTERRRLERDLHDGVQPRLVATAMTLGMARSRFDQDPDGARQMVDQAHQEVKDSITELRQLARGIHPAVLTDRGLDAALSALASRSPVPVSVHLQVTERLGREIEALLYFVVAEALTNAAKHSGAGRVTVSIDRFPGLIRTTIADDGRGGAAFVPGGGLSGIRDRVRSAGASIHLHSPEGGPTSITVEVPCES